MSGRRVRESSSDTADDSSWVHVSSQAPPAGHETSNRAALLQRQGKRTTDSQPNDKLHHLQLDTDVETDALVSCEADDGRQCAAETESTPLDHTMSCTEQASRHAHPLSTTTDSRSCHQETTAGARSMIDSSTHLYYVGGRLSSAAAETVMLVSRGVANSNDTGVVYAMDDSQPLAAASQTQAAGGPGSNVGGLIRENTMLRQINQQQAEKICQLSKQLTHTENLDELHLLKEQLSVYKEDFENERRDKQRALSEKDSLIKQTTTLLNDLKILQDRNQQLDAALRIARQNTLSDDEDRRRRWAHTE